MSATEQPPRRDTDGGTAEARVNRQIDFNRRRAVKADHTDNIDRLAADFDYEACRNAWWNPEEFSLLWGTSLWDQSTLDQKRALNHLFWVAYYSQIISAEITTIYFNQVAAAGLYGAGDFRGICDTLDLESRQERAHVAAFKSIGEAVERTLLGETLFSHAMHGPLVETMRFSRNGRLSSRWRSMQMAAYGLIAPQRPTLAAYYLLIRGLRTLNGKLVQERLAAFVTEGDAAATAPIPSLISQAHFIDESFHFNTSRIIAHEVPDLLPRPTSLERFAINRAVMGCQQDHRSASAAINGIFWHDPALYPAVYRLLTGPIFELSHAGALDMMDQCFCQENDGLTASLKTHATAVANYRAFVADVDFLRPSNRDMTLMARTSVPDQLRINRKSFTRFRARPPQTR